MPYEIVGTTGSWCYLYTLDNEICFSQDYHTYEECERAARARFEDNG